MDTNDLYVLKRMLGVLKDIGSTGVRKDDLLDQAEIAADRPLTTDQRERVFAALKDRHYIVAHLQPITHHERWTLTERGLTAYEAL